MEGVTAEWLRDTYLSLLRQSEPLTFVQLFKLGPIRNREVYTDFFHRDLVPHLTANAIVDNRYRRVNIYYSVRKAVGILAEA